eukprot:4098212-Pyramimonas_sp.AAC.1
MLADSPRTDPAYSLNLDPLRTLATAVWEQWLPRRVLEQGLGGGGAAAVLTFQRSALERYPSGSKLRWNDGSGEKSPIVKACPSFSRGAILSRFEASLGLGSSFPPSVAI